MSEQNETANLGTIEPEKLPNKAATAEAFSFGDPIPVLDRRELLDYVECVQMDRWYEPPVSFDGLARTYRAAVHHSSPIAVKRNILTSTFIPHPLLSQQAFSRFVQDYLVFGNAYLEKRTNRLGGILSLEPSLAKYTRRGIDLDTYWFVQYGMTTQPYEFTNHYRPQRCSPGDAFNHPQDLFARHRRPVSHKMQRHPFNKSVQRPGGNRIKPLLKRSLTGLHPVLHHTS